MRTTIDHAELIKMLDYSPETGVFTWKVFKGGSAKVGAKAGTPTDKGYLTIQVHRYKRTAHRLAWFYVHGVWPPEEVDHKNGDRKDNSISNLRLASRRENITNTRTPPTNKSGHRGVNYRDGSWRARIGYDKKRYHLGCFNTFEEAVDAYQQAAERFHGEFANKGEVNV